MTTSRVSLLNLLLLTWLPVGGVGAQTLRPRLRQVVTPPARKQNLRLYLLIGQLNMAGRGFVEAEDTVPNARVLRLNPAGQWEVAKAPFHFDSPAAAVGPGLTFGRLMAAQDNRRTIGLIPCAVGGTGIDAWAPGAYFEGTVTHPYDDALARARVALRTGTLAGIIWHQGETDNTPEKSAEYEPKLKALVARLRADLRAPTVPFVAGQLPDFRLDKAGADGQPHPNATTPRINQAVAALQQQVPNYAYITVEGTADIGDDTHFDAASARLLGRRYAATMQQLQRPAHRPNRFSLRP